MQTRQTLRTPLAPMNWMMGQNNKLKIRRESVRHEEGKGGGENSTHRPYLGLKIDVSSALDEQRSDVGCAVVGGYMQGREARLKKDVKKKGYFLFDASRGGSGSLPFNL